MKFSITKFGKKLKKSLYTWDKKTQTLSTNEDNLVLDFPGIDRITFKTGSNCTFNTGHSCTFNTNSDCTFKVDHNCIIIRRDIFEVIEVPGNVKIRLNGYGIVGYEKILQK